MLFTREQRHHIVQLDPPIISAVRGYTEVPKYVSANYRIYRRYLAPNALPGFIPHSTES